LLTPAVWSGISVQAASNGNASNLPVAGPNSATGGTGGIGGGTPGAFNQARGDAPAGAGERPGTNGEMPTGGEAPSGSATQGNTTRNAGGGMGGQIDAQMLAWLEAQQGDTTYLVAVSSAGQASSIILETGESVMALGGFSGSDPILTADDLAQLVANGTIRYAIAGGQGGGQGGGQSDLATWITQHGTAVSATAWGGTGTSQLYDLGTGQ
jgi:hypothetical protein